MLRLLSRGRKAEAAGEDEHKKYKKANLGEANKLYYNEELKMWVEKGKEQEARAEKEKLNAPPPPAGMTPASSTTSLVGTGDATSAGPPPPAPSFARDRSLKGRYLATPGAGLSASGTSSGPPSGKHVMPGSGPPSGTGLVPSMPGVPGIPAVPGIPGAPKVPGMPSGRPGSFFMPTPAASEVASDAAGGDNSSTIGSMSQSQSGMSMDAFMAGGQPPFFVPGAPASSTAGGSGSGSGGGGAADGQAEATPAADVTMGEGGRSPADRDSSAGGSHPPALGGPGNLSFAMWQPPQPVKQQQQQPPLAGNAADGVSPSGSQVSQQQADKQQAQPSQQLPYAGASSNGSHAQYGSYNTSGFPGMAENGNAQSTAAGGAAGEHTTQQAYSSAWPSQPSADVGDSAGGPGELAGGMTAAATTAPAGGEDGGEGGNYNWAEQPGYDPLGAPQDPLGQPQDPFGVPGVPAQGATAEGGWGGESGAWGETGSWGEMGGWTGEAGAGTAGLQGGTAAGDAATADAEGGGAGAIGYAADGYGQYTGWGQQGYAYDAATNTYYQAEGYGSQQQAAAPGSDAAQQQYAQTNGYAGYGASYDYYGQGQPQTAEDSASMPTALPDSSVGAAEGTAPATADGQQYHQQQQDQPAAEQQVPVLLDPVHPELPGITTTVSKGSDDLGPLSSTKRAGLSAGAAAAARHRSAPGSAPHPSGLGRPGSPPSSGGFMSVPPARSTSMHAGGVNGLLPPTRPSMNGSATALHAESSALTLPPTAVAGDASMLTTVRPSSPYARPVSPLSRTNTGMSDSSSAGKGAAQGFPIPSPPLQVFGKPGVFVPGAPGQQQQQQQQQLSAAAPAGAWQPSVPGVAEYVGSPGGNLQQQQQQQGVFGPPMVLNGYMGPVGGSPQHTGDSSHGSMPGAAAAGSRPVPWGSSSSESPHQQQQQQHGSHAGASRFGDVQYSQHAPGVFVPGGLPSTAGAGAGAAIPAASPEQRAHPYDAFVNTELTNINWKARHFKQPGKLNKLLPHEQFEMEKALEEEQQQQQGASPASKPDAFWYRQMEYRQKLPAGAMKPSASEPTHMPSHAVAGRAQSPMDSNISNASFYTNWQQQQQQAYPQQDGTAAAAVAAAVPPCTPARGVAGDAAYAAAAPSPGEEPTPTSKLAAAPAAGEAAGSPSVAQQHLLMQQQHLGQEQVGSQDGATVAAAATADAAGGNSWQPEQPGQGYRYAAYYGGYGEQQQQQQQLQADGQYQYFQQGYEQQYYQQGGYEQPGYQQQQGDYQQDGYGQQQACQVQEQQQQQPVEAQQQQQHVPPEQQLHPSWGSVVEQMLPDQEVSQTAGAAAGSAASDAGVCGNELQQQHHHHKQLDEAAEEAGHVWGSDAGVLDAFGEHAGAAGGGSVGGAGEAADAAHQQHLAAGVQVPTETATTQPSPAAAAVADMVQSSGAASEDIHAQHAAAAAAGSAEAAAEHAAAVAASISSGLEGAEGAEAGVADAGADGWEGAETAADADGWEGAEALVLSDEASGAAAAAAAAEGVEWPEDGAAEVQVAEAVVATEASAEAIAAAPEYPAQWLNIRVRLSATALDGDMVGHRDTFIQWGDFVFASLPDVASWHAEAAEQEQAAGQLDDVFQKYGEAEMRADIMEGGFRQSGLEVDSLLKTLQELEM